MINPKLGKVVSRYSFLFITNYAIGNAPVLLKTLNNEDFNPVENIIGAPISQSDMQERFNKMSEAREKNGEKSITVITEGTLHKIWDDVSDDNYDVHSLSTEEVLYIISDSIRLYNEYDEIVLCGYRDEAYLNSRAKYSSWLVKPILEENVIIPIHDLDSYRIGEDYFTLSSYKYTEEEKQDIISTKSKSVAYDMMINDIYKIIMYRITALSSPFCTINLGEAAGISPEIWNNNLEYKTKFYISGFTKKADRAKIVEQLNPARDSTNTSNLFDFFKYNMIGDDSSIYLISNNWETTSKVFPTAELETLNPDK